VSIELTSHVERSVEVAVEPEQAFALLCDVPDSVSHFPDLDRLTGADGTYTWTLKKVGVGKVSIQLVYACAYANDPATRSLTWTPVEGVGNGVVSGSWSVEAVGSGTRLTLRNHLVLTLDLPRLLRGVAEGLVARENARMIEAYVANLATTLRGGDGRVSAAAIATQ
jgi:carbon monoxide dehydrogenase subunit G